jgi:hypothetical protein
MDLHLQLSDAGGPAEQIHAQLSERLVTPDPGRGLPHGRLVHPCGVMSPDTGQISRDSRTT